MLKPLIPISRKQAFFFAFFLVLYEFLTYLANDMIMPGMLDVVHSFHSTESMVATSLTVYMLGGASLQIILGPVSDAFGRRPVMLCGAILFCLFTFLIAAAHSMEQFLLARFFQGMGLCFISVIGYTAIQELFEEMDAIRVIAIMANAAILAPLLGPLLGAIVIHYASWRIIFIVIAFLSFCVAWGLWIYMPEPIGQVTKKGVLIARTAFTPHAIIKNYSVLLKNKSFCFAVLAISLVGIPCITWIALAPIIFIAESRLSVIEYGLWQLPVFGATIIGNWFLHRLTYRYEMKKIISIGCVLLLLGTSLMAWLPYCYGNHYYYLLPGIMIYFFALSVVSAPLNRFCLYTTQVSKGTASAIISLSIMSIDALGIEIGNFIYQSHNHFYFGLYQAGSIAFFIIALYWAFKFNYKNIHNGEKY